MNRAISTSTLDFRSRAGSISADQSSLATDRFVARALSKKSVDQYQGSIQHGVQCARRVQNIGPCRCLHPLSSSYAAYYEDRKLCLAVQRSGIFSGHNQFLYGLWHDSTAPCYRPSTGAANLESRKGQITCV